MEQMWKRYLHLGRYHLYEDGGGTHTWDAIVCTRAFGEQPVPDLPREDGGALPLELGDLGHDVWGGHSRLAASDGPGTDGAGLVVPAQDLGHAAVRDLEDAGDVAGPGAAVGQLHDLLTRGVWQGTTVHVHAAQLVDAAVACKTQHAPSKQISPHHRRRIIHNYLSELFSDRKTIRDTNSFLTVPASLCNYPTINRRHHHDHPQSTKSGGPTKEKAQMTLICRSGAAGG
ncbi:hypothetical protein CEXT_240131 [Caerostris extrusa]|uniref:Uncharacterized protein n=1 Tax=Caerostris extrusa TaxID=172846 RepID=A0AAV4PU58_CAEEX|nr:hypothetical protein CEXT_240131 [Caerostris extrusa]